MRQVFEMGMLICFGASWPISVYKSFVSRSTKGKSILFLFLIFTGYILGLLGKIIYDPSYVMVFYCLNAFFVGADIVMYYRNRRIEGGAK